MKKLILSAVFALACFTAQAKNEGVSNDDKNPKGKTKVVVKLDRKIILPLGCTACGFTNMVCDGVATSVGSCQTADTCGKAAKKLVDVLSGAGCN